MATRMPSKNDHTLVKRPSTVRQPEAKRARRVKAVAATSVGLLDLGAWVARMPLLLERMNAAQDSFRFLEVMTPVPAGLIKTRESLAAWSRANGTSQGEVEAHPPGRNMVADEFLYFAEGVRKEHSLDYLFGLTTAMVAFTEDGRAHWNYFAFGRDHVSLVSTFDLRRYAAEARRPYEAAVGMLLVAQMLGLKHGVPSHEETRGCIFDFDANRDDVVVAIRQLAIDPQCLRLLPPEEAAAADALLAALRRMKEH
ncbi:hypothetical protein [Ramlibacter sp.]|uniref:hypothetical protein n=1 Tax=Ramlibacter sp. TaxID=1917967 RepID=UPI003D09AC36